MTQKKTEIKPKQQKSPFVACIAIVCLAGLEVAALLTGHNGTMYTIIVAAIAGIGGFMLPSPFQKK